MKTLSDTSEIQDFLGTDPIQSASIRLTTLCNLRCKQCYSSSGEVSENELSTLELKKLIDDLFKNGVMRIFFTGGEPFIRPDIIEVLEYCDNKGIGIYISTNGTLITKEQIQALSTFRHLKTFQISIDGLYDLHDEVRGVPGTFSKAVKTVTFARKNIKNAKIIVASTLLSDNFKQIEEMVEYFDDLDIDVFALVPLYPVKREKSAQDISTKEKYRLFEKLGVIQTKLAKTGSKLMINILAPPALIPEGIKKSQNDYGYICTFPSIVGISSTGEIAPCDGLLDIDGFNLGNIREHELAEIYDGSELMKQIKSVSYKDLTGVCKKCKYIKLCAGACRARSYLDSDSFSSSHPLCQDFYDKGFFQKENLDDK